MHAGVCMSVRECVRAAGVYMRAHAHTSRSMLHVRAYKQTFTCTSFLTRFTEKLTFMILMHEHLQKHCVA